MRALLLVAALAGLSMAAPLPGTLAAANHTVDMVFQQPGLFLFKSSDTGTGVFTVQAGDTVTFCSASTIHAVNSGLENLAEPAESLAPGALHLNTIATGNIPSGQCATVLIPEPGLYPYYCSAGLHRFTGMRGLIVAQ